MFYFDIFEKLTVKILTIPSRRIISEVLLSEYAYFIKPNGILYTVTDVEDLHNWHVEKCTAHPYFVRYMLN